MIFCVVNIVKITLSNKKNREYLYLVMHFCSKIDIAPHTEL